jgi:Tol biopolymer transport system component
MALTSRLFAAYDWRLHYRALMIGQVLGHYRVDAPLGSGGMGVVYRAFDTLLRRVVAIKLLNAAPHERRTHVLFEARAASALNHPNVCTIYEVEECDEQAFIVMEYVEGKRLCDLIPRGGLPLDAVLRYGVQIADALAHAHDKHIVHRDLKSSNVIVTADGRAKVLDFGVAAHLPAFNVKTATRTLPQRRPLGGTVPYMSPEMIRGHAVDARSDIWGLGVLLYEMASAERPFRGTTTPQIIAAILEQPPAALPHVSASFRNVVLRCLAKEPGQRYQHAGEVRSSLETIQTIESTILAGTPFVAQTRLHTRRGLALAAVAVTALTAAGAAYWWVRPRASSVPIVRLVNPVQVTNAVGVEDHPSWSPDGGMLAYAVNPSGDPFGGNWDIHLTQLGGGPSVNRTSDHPGDDRFPSLSPNGHQIAFWSDRDGGGYFVMPALTGAPRKILATVGLTGVELSPPQWSSDGSEFACVGKDATGFVIQIISPVTGVLRSLRLPARVRPLDVSWSPTGRFFAFIDAGNRTAQVSRLWLLRSADQETFPVTDGWTNDWNPSWSHDERSLYFVSNRRGSMDLWRQPIAENGTPLGAPEELTTGIGMRHAAWSPDGRMLAYSKGLRVGNLWRVPVLPRRAVTWADATQLTFDQALIESADFSPNGQRLIVSSDRSGNPDLWTLPAAGGEMQQVTNHLTPDWAPQWSPDGQHIAFYAYRSGNRDIWTIQANTGTLRQLTSSDAADAFPTWSPDGRHLAFLSDRSGNTDIWIMRADGGETRQLTTDPAQDLFPEWSPDGHWIAFASLRTGDWRLWRASTTPGERREEQLTQGPAFRLRWAPDGNTIYFVGWGKRGGNLWAVSLANGVERQVTNLRGRRGSLGMLVLATDGKRLLFTWEEDLGDLWVMNTTVERRAQP